MLKGWLRPSNHLTFDERSLYTSLKIFQYIGFRYYYGQLQRYYSYSSYRENIWIYCLLDKLNLKSNSPLQFGFTSSLFPIMAGLLISEEPATKQVSN
jgi:hypothetical protein